MRHALATAALVALTLPAAAETRIGVSMTAFDNPFLTILLNGIREGAGRIPDVDLAVEDAQLDVGRQLNQVQNFIANGVDALIVNPVDGESAAAITKLATEAKIPLVYVNHPPADVEALPAGTTFVGSNETESGTMQAEAVCKALGGKGAAVILIGPLENISARIRTDDVKAVLAKPDCAGIEILDEQVANWSRVEGQDKVTNWLTAGLEFDAVISNNDEMAIGAIQALKSAGVAMDDVVVAGIDATPDGLAAMAAGELDLTVFQNATRQGELAAEAAAKMAAGDTVERALWVPFEPVTPDNMATYAK